MTEITEGFRWIRMSKAELNRELAKYAEGSDEARRLQALIDNYDKPLEDLLDDL